MRDAVGKTGLGSTKRARQASDHRTPLNPMSKTSPGCSFLKVGGVEYLRLVSSRCHGINNFQLIYKTREVWKIERDFWILKI